ncbi:MAG: hypothetical protein CMJ18_03845 [Phycisphaeraceae bacterium]|nr:hypothetical protein [Phycisphaeraceae bacterium]
MTLLHAHSPDGEDLEHLVIETRRRLRKTTLATGAGVAAAVIIGSLTLTALVDMLLPLPVPMRVALATMFWSLVAVVTIGGVFWPALRRLHLDGVAHRIERTVPAMHNRLITVLDLRRGRLADSDIEFVERLLDQTRTRLNEYEPQRVARRRPQKIAAVVAGLAALASILLLAVCFDRLPTAVARILRPTAEIAPVSHIVLRSVTGDLRVLEGDPIEIVASVERGDVQTLTCRLGEADGRWHDYPMLRDDDGRFVFRIEALHTSCRYRIDGGGTWTATHRITMIRRPIVERVSASVQLPTYTRLDTIRAIDPEDTQVKVLEGSTVIVEAEVRGAVAGTLEILETGDGEGDAPTERRIVWFDDDLPPDAISTGTWRWVQRPAFSGTRAHTFDWKREPYGFTTRLHPIVVQPEATFFVMIRLDERDPPSQVTITLRHAKGDHALTWRAEPEENDVGPLPDAGRWIRLTAPASVFMAADATEPLPLEGMTFAVDQGRATFDRTGLLLPPQTADPVRALRPIRSIDMTHDAQRGSWHASFVAERDCAYAARFRNELDQSNAALRPVAVSVTADQPPTVIVEQPVEDVLVDELLAVPLLGRGFDDYGVQNLAIQFRVDGDESYGAVTALPGGVFEAPVSSRTILGSVDTRAHDLQRGQAVEWRLVATDFKGQVGHTEPRRITLATAEQRSGDGVARRPAALRRLLDDLARALSAQKDVTQAAGEMADRLLPPPPTGETPVGTLTLVNPDGTPMTPEQIQEHFAQARATLTDEQREQLDALNKRLVEQHEMYRALAERFNQSVADSEASALALPQEAMLLREMSAGTARQAELADRMQRTAEEPHLWAELDRTAPQMERMMRDLHRQIEQLERSRRELAEDPLAARDRMLSLMAAMEGRGALRMLDGLDESVRDHRDAMRQLQNRLETLSQKVEDAAAETLEELSREQAELDRQAIERMRAAMDMLESMSDQPRDETELQAPWAPPRAARRMPVEQDTPEEQLETDKAPNDATRSQAPEAPDDADWWDRRVEFPSEARWQTLLEERFADRDRPVDRPEGDEPEAGMISPRELLAAHQRAMGQQLTQNSNELARARRNLGEMSQELNSMLQSLRRGGAADPAADRARIMSRMNRMMSSARMRRFGALARRADTLLVRPSTMAPAGPTWQLTNLALPAGTTPVLDAVETELTGRQRATFYRLPPSIRHPLIQGMGERGPDGYQHLIDAYYRLLAEAVREPEP